MTSKLPPSSSSPSSSSSTHFNSLFPGQQQQQQQQRQHFNSINSSDLLHCDPNSSKRRLSNVAEEEEDEGQATSTQANDYDYDYCTTDDDEESVLTIDSAALTGSLMSHGSILSSFSRRTNTTNDTASWRSSNIFSNDPRVSLLQI